MFGKARLGAAIASATFVPAREGANHIALPFLRFAVREETTRGYGKIYDEAERLGRSVPPRPSPVAESCYRFMLPFVLCWLGITSTRVATFFVSRRSYDALTFSPSRMSDRVA